MAGYFGVLPGTVLVTTKARIMIHSSTRGNNGPKVPKNCSKPRVALFSGQPRSIGLLIDRGFVLHEKAHGQEGTVLGYHYNSSLRPIQNS